MTTLVDTRNKSPVKRFNFGEHSLGINLKGYFVTSNFSLLNATCSFTQELFIDIAQVTNPCAFELHYTMVEQSRH